MVLTEHKNPEEAEDVMISGSSMDASSSGVSVESVGMESRACLMSASA